MLTRRRFLSSVTSAVAAVPVIQASVPDDRSEPSSEPVIDIHQHTNYWQRSHEALLSHQKTMGVTQTILLPSGSSVSRQSTGNGKFNGLGGVGAGGNESVLLTSRQHPGSYYFGANEVTDLDGAIEEIRKYLELGAIIIGEQKFDVECDSDASQRLYALAGEHRVPILLHFQHGTYNRGFERLPKMLEKYPETIFIGHAQTFWANIDRNHSRPEDLYPKGPVTAGGLTDRYLADYPNMFADMSAGSGLNALTRDEDHARGFLERHSRKILYGSDCADAEGSGPKCQGSQTIAAIRRLSPTKETERAILYENARVLFRL